MIRTTLSTALVAACFALPAMAEIEVTDAYARASGPTAKAGAAFMVITNTGDTADRLLSASSEAAMRVEIHTHKDMGDGVMKMMEVVDGLPIAAGESHALQRGGDHVMFMGLTAPFEQNKVITVTLQFEEAGPITIEVPVDLTR